MKSAKYRNESGQKIDRLRKYKPKSIDLKQPDIFRQDYPIGDKEFNILQLYDNMGFSEKTVMCGTCGHRGTLQKNGEYYQVSHTQVKDQQTCYFGKEFVWNVMDIPVRIIYNAKKITLENKAANH